VTVVNNATPVAKGRGWLTDMVAIALEANRMISRTRVRALINKIILNAPF